MQKVLDRPGAFERKPPAVPNARFFKCMRRPSCPRDVLRLRKLATARNGPSAASRRCHRRHLGPVEGRTCVPSPELGRYDVRAPVLDRLRAKSCQSCRSNSGTQSVGVLPLDRLSLLIKSCVTYHKSLLALRLIKRNRPVSLDSDLRGEEGEGVKGVGARSAKGRVGGGSGYGVGGVASEVCHARRPTGGRGGIAECGKWYRTL